MAVKKKKVELDRIESFVADIVWGEYQTSLENQSGETSEFEAVIDLLECERTEKEYEWMSDVFLPEYPSILLTESSQWASQYFQSREFVEVFLEDDREENALKCKAVKKLLNKILNVKGLYHYQKYIRSRTINSLAGASYLVCWWEKEKVKRQTGIKRIPYEMETDEMGTPLTPEAIQMGAIPAIGYREEPVFRTDVLIDRFNYEVLDPRNVFTDNKYVYSLQDKDFFIYRSEKSYEALRADGIEYINLDKVKELAHAGETDTSQASYNKAGKKSKVKKPQVREFDVLTRYGKSWAVITERDDWQRPTAIKPGYDDQGNPGEEAEYIETIMSIAYVGNQKVLIRYEPLKYYDAKGRTYRPIIRGLCYIHPTKDVGMSDGKYARELQVAINDTINLSNDRVKLATLPTFIGSKQALTDNDSLFIEPEHFIEVDDPTKDLKELQIRDNIQGALAQTDMFIKKLQQVESVYPTTMGDLPGFASTTATAVAGAETRANTRSNYKSLTVEYTMLNEFYWMILQMAYEFMEPSTAVEILGDDVIHFDPNCDYAYQPVTSAIEMEYSKQNKIKMWDQILGRVVSIPNPKTPALVNFIMTQISELMGKEFSQVKKYLLDERVPPPEVMNPAAPVGQNTGSMGAGTSNQNQIPMSTVEGYARGLQ